MRSPAEPGRGGVRRFLEGAAHGLALGILAWLLLGSLRGPGAGPAEFAGVGTLGVSLPRWSTVARPERVHLTIDGDLTPAALDWLAALVRSGIPVRWDPGRAAPVAAVAEPVADPQGGTRVRAAADAGVTVTLADSLGSLDSVTAARGGVTFLARSGPAWIIARAGQLGARAAVADSLVFGRILLLGKVGWESKFVMAALEERGWRVEARLGLSPTGTVLQGITQPLDTARYSAVIVLDSAPPGSLAAVPAYIRSGGGAILATSATRAPALRGLGSALLQSLLPAGEPFDTMGAEPRRSLGLMPIADVPGQVALERRSGRTALAARRIERGRLLIVGYQDTWRWRMAGGGDAAEAHRTWWADLVGAVAYVGRIQRERSAASVDEAPFAHLVDRLGPPSAAAGRTTNPPSVSQGALFGILAGLLLLGWASRRMRGAA
jgi:hypothetical protein